MTCCYHILDNNNNENQSLPTTVFKSFNNLNINNNNNNNNNQLHFIDPKEPDIINQITIQDDM